MQDSQTNTFLKGMNLDTAKEFVGTDQYIYATDVHINGDSETTAALQEYCDICEYIVDLQLTGTVCGATRGKICITTNDVKTVTDCAIYLTTYQDTQGNDTNSLLVYTFDNGENPTARCVYKLDHNLNITKAAKLINVYENEQISRVYIASERKHIFAININTPATEYSKDKDFSIFPKCGMLKPFVFDDEVDGSLLAGKYQYAYQLFNKDGQTSAVSVLSHPMLCGSELKGGQTQIGFKLKLDTTKIIGDWEYIKIYAIYYADNINPPQVLVKTESNFNKDVKDFVWIDYNNTALTSITLEEFDSIKQAPFFANTIAAKDNILFAAGIRYDDWDVEFDARAYPSDEIGNIKMSNQHGVEISTTQSDIINGAKEIPEDFDCIIDYDLYKYNYVVGEIQQPFNQFGQYDVVNPTANKTRAYGGAGINVQYMFEHPMFYLAPYSGVDCIDEGTGAAYLSDQLNQSKYSDYSSNVNHMKVIRPRFTNIDTEWPLDHEIKCSHKIHNITFEDTYICANYTGFKQGELYRFGIVFYNNRGQRSPVHWIGDIKIPRSSHWIFNSVSSGFDNATTQYYHDLVATGVGITFKINSSSIAEDVVGFEIVRCDRRPEDRTILCQGLAGRTILYDDKGVIGRTMSQFTFPTLNAVHDTLEGQTIEHDASVFLETHLAFVSPEVSASKENISDYIDNVTKLYPITPLASYIVSDDATDFETTDLTVPSDKQAKPIFKRVRIGISAKSFKNGKGNFTANDDTFGRYAILFSDRPGGSDDKWVGPYLSLGRTKDLHFGLFKFYQPCMRSRTTGYHSAIDVIDANYIAGNDFTTTSDSGLSSKAVAINNDKFINWGTSGGSDFENQGAHGPCVLIQIPQSNVYAITYYGAQYNDGEIHTIKNWCRLDLYGGDYFDYFPLAVPLGVTKPTHQLGNTAELHTSVPIADSQYIIGDGEYKYDVKRELIKWETGYDDAFLARLNNSALLCELVTNVTPYNGINHAARTNSTYISTGQFCEISDESNQYFSCYGGDTYVILHDELWQQYVATQNPDFDHNVCVTAIKYPVETTVNLARANGVNFSTDPENPGLFYEPSIINGYAQDKPLNAYNDAYNAHEVGKVSFQKGIWDLSNQYIPNRIIHSDAKSTGELIDSFQIFKPANYRDVDNNFGGVTNLVDFNNTLVFFQDTACGYVSVNERSLIADNQAQLLLGTGGVLSAHQYYTQVHGDAIINDTSIVKASSAIYWYDTLKKSIDVLNNSIEPLSLAKSVQTYVNSFADNTQVYGGYDFKNKEVWFRSNTEDKSLIYSELLGQFVSFYSKPIQHSVTMPNNTVNIVKSGDSLNLYSVGKSHANYAVGKPSVKFAVNKNPSMTKTFDVIAVNDTFSNTQKNLKLHCSYTFETGRQTASETTESMSNKVIEGIYYTYVPRDDNKSRMRDRVMTVEMEFKPNTNFHIPNVNTLFRTSLH